MCSPEYLYYHLPCPWLQVKCLRYLQFYKVTDGPQHVALFFMLSNLLCCFVLYCFVFYCIVLYCFVLYFLCNVLFHSH